MQTIHCQNKYEVDHLKGVKLTAADFDVLVGGNENAEVYKPNGDLLLSYRPDWFSKKLCYDSIDSCRAAVKKTNNRGTASGVPTVTRILKNGRTSSTTVAQPVNSGIVGYFDRQARFPFCRQTSFLVQDAAKWSKFVPYIQRADEGFRELAPARWESQKRYADLTSNDWVIPQSTFTTVTINKNWQTATHKDAGDLKQGMGVMSCLRNNKYEGAYLCFPSFRVAVDMSNGSIVVADVHEWHGNTPFVNIKTGYERITSVFYYREKMIQCKTAKEEVSIAKNRKTGDTMY